MAFEGINKRIESGASQQGRACVSGGLQGGLGERQGAWAAASWGDYGPQHCLGVGPAVVAGAGDGLTRGRRTR